MKVDPVRVWIGPVVRRGAGGGARFIRSLASHSSHQLKAVVETPEILWGIRWAGRRIPLVESAYAYYQAWIRWIDVAHIHRSLLYAEAFKAAGGKVPWIYTLHGIGFEEFWKDQPHMEKWIRESNRKVLQIIGQATVATVVARWLRDWVEERTSITVAVTPPGVDVSEFRGARAEEFIEWSGLSEGFILWVGRPTREKRLEYFIQLASRIPDQQFVVMANTESERFIADYGPDLPSNLHYFGMAPRRYVVSAFHACSVHVNTSLYDTAPTTLLEAMACGKPVVAPDWLGPREIVEDSKAGFLFDPTSTEDLEEQVQLALCHPEVGRRGIDFVREKRDWRRLVRYFDEQYSLLAGRS